MHFTSPSMILQIVCLIIFSQVYTETEFGAKSKANPKHPTPGSGLSNEECVRRIYSDCNHPTTFTDEELENVRQFLNYSFTVKADIKPDKPLCPKLHVRHDWKCLSQQQKTRLIRVWKVMYERKDIQKLNDIHVRYWPAWHKTGESDASHRWLCNQFEVIMRSIDPGVTLPYWDSSLYGTQPERSTVWDVLGRAGNYSNGYCVRNGMYHKWNLTPCMKRHWSHRDTIYPWFTQETETSYLQTSVGFADIDGATTGDHFPVHLNVGGYEGQYATTTATYDVLFYMHHLSVEDNHILRWQLQRPENLTPLTYNTEINLKYNSNNGCVEKADNRKDFVGGLRDVSVRQMYWVGFGDLCYITDQFVRPINRIWKGIKDSGATLPTALKRLKALPQWVLKKHFPLFLSGNYSELHYHLEEVGDCNNRCLPIPKPTLISETEIGRRQLEAFVYDNGHDISNSYAEDEKYQVEILKDLNSVGYCSPYVTTY